VGQGSVPAGLWVLRSLWTTSYLAVRENLPYVLAAAGAAPLSMVLPSVPLPRPDAGQTVV